MPTRPPDRPAQPGWHGIFPYLVSPVDPDGRVRVGVLTRLAEHLISRDVHGLSPLGSTGEFPYLTAPQRVEVVRAVVEAARGRVPVVPGVAAHSTHDAIEQIRRVLDVGADGVILILQTYFPLPREGVTSFFETVAGAVGCPICVYTNPRLLGFDLTPDQIVALSEIPNIRYVKDASGETGRLLTILNRTEGRIAVFSASAHIPLLVFRLGGVGWMAGPACLLPEACVRLYDLARAGRWEDADRLQRRLWPVNEVFQRHGLAACVKAGLRLQGFETGDPIPPQRPLGEAAVDDIRRALETAGG
ncbi:MAG TPA: dihydrodipicolinate synthase family protein [bacterium]|nr:dihydrodipicolinate synthase family protein [bacterium]